MNKNTDNSLDFLLGFAMYWLLWPLFNEFVTELIWVFGYDQNLGGGLLRFLVSALSLLAGTVFLLIFWFSRKKPHPPLQGKKIAAWVLVAILLSTAMFNVTWKRNGFFCKIGECPSMN